MKRIHISLVAVALCIAIVSKAQVHNYIALSAQVGESSLLTDIEQLSPKGSIGAGGGIGASYELEANHFLLHVGVAATVSHSVFFSKELTETISRVYDDEGDLLDYIYEQSSRKDAYTSISAQVPLMIGASAGHFYFLAGAKVQLGLFGSAHSEAVLSAKGRYDKFIDDFEGMPEHTFFKEVPFTTKNNVSFKPNVLASIELGYRFGNFGIKTTGYDVPKTNNYGRLAVFADFGVLDIHKKGNQTSISLPTSFNPSDMTSSIRLTDILSSSAAKSAVHPLMVGVKYTYLFRLPEKKICVICRE